MGDGMGPGGGIRLRIRRPRHGVVVSGRGHPPHHTFLRRWKRRGVDGRSETTAGGRSTTSGDPALAELRERYARGEIDDEEFERRAQQLRSTADSEK